MMIISGVVKRLIHTVIFSAILLPLITHAQAPIISYATPPTYTAGTSIATLSPANSGGAVPLTRTYIVTTFAGQATPGSTNATGTAASFRGPRGISSDNSGNLYIADDLNNQIRKITPAGVVTLFAGAITPTSGNVNGTTTAARFNGPYDITDDGAGNFYVADNFNNSIRKITPAGVVTTLASVTTPVGIAYDSFSNSLFVTTGTNNTIVKVTLTGTTTTFAGSATAGNTNGTGTSAMFNTPNGITTDEAGNLYIADQGNNQIRKITPAGVVSLFAGNPAGTAGAADGTTTAASFNTPRGIGADPLGNIYVADNGNFNIRLITPAGVVTTVAGSTANALTDGTGTTARFNNPRNVNVDPITGVIYIADFDNNAIRKITPTGYSISAPLPAGLNFNTSNGQITGTPTTATPSTTYTITAWNTSGSSTTTATLNVGPAVTTPAANCGSGTFSLTVSGGSAGGTYKLYAASTGGTSLASTTTNTLVTPTISATGTYYVSYTGTTTAETDRTAVTLTVSATPFVALTTASGLQYSYPFSGNANDAIGGNNGTVQGAAQLTTDRYGAANSAYSFDGSTQYISTATQIPSPGPQEFTISLWFKSTAAAGAAGGKLLGFGNVQSGGNSGSYDRHIYMTSSGQLVFGVYSGTADTIRTGKTYNDKIWHQVTASFSTTAGTKLYVDGVLASSNAAQIAAQSYAGYWRIGYDNINGWPAAPTNWYFTGSLDDVQIYNRTLSANEVYNLQRVVIDPVCSGGTLNLFAKTVNGATYSWTGPNSFTSTSQNPTIANATAVNAGTYTVTVTGSTGCVSTASGIASIYALPTAIFTAPASVDVSQNAAIALTSTYDAASTYTWDFNGGTPSTGSGNGPFSVQWATTGIKTITLTVTNANSCTLVITKTVAVGAASFSGYAFKKQLVLNTTSAGITNNQTNFPALVYIQDNNLIASNTCNNKVQYPLGNYNGAPGSNYDFAFLDPTSATELNYQVESYNPTTGTLLVWVKIPTLYAKTNNTLSFYFGSLTPAHNATFYSNTWPSDYLAVYHFNEDPSVTTTVLDATNNHVDGVSTNVSSTTDKIHAAAGLTGGGYSFNGTSKIITTQTANITGNAFTLSAWVSVTTPGGDNKVVSNEIDFGPGYKLAVKANVIETETRSTNTMGTLGNLGDGGTVTTGWHYIQGTFTGTSFKNYLDSVAATTTLTKIAASMTPLAGSVVSIGVDNRSGATPDENYYQGLMDEVRISNVIKSSDWIRAEYTNQTTPLTFTDYSAAATINHAVAITIPGALTYTWIGASGVDGNIAANWTNTTESITGQLPNNNASVNIPAGLSNYPKLSTALTVYGLTIANSANIDLNGQTLTVGCNIYNNGVINPAGVSNASTVIFNGTFTPQFYTGTNTANTAQFGNITINNTAASGIVRITGGPVDLYNTLTLTSGSLDINNAGNGAFTLKSTGTQTARVAQITTGAVTGNVKAERFVTGGPGYNNTRKNWTYRNYRIMSSPVYTATSPANVSSLAYIVASSIVTGATCPTCTTSSTGNPTLYLYREDFAGTNLNFNSGNFRAVTNITTEALSINGESGSKYLYPGTGFLFYFRGNKTTNAAAKIVSPFVAPESVVFTNTGVLNQGAVQVKNWQTGTTTLLGTNTSSVATARGLNLVGNPYASSIDWDNTTGFTTTNISTSIYIFNPVTNQYETYVRNSGGAGTGAGSGDIIASGQAFFIKIASIPGTGSFTFNEAAKSATQLTSGANLLLSTALPGTETPVSFMRVRLTLDSLNHDNIVLVFRDGTDPKYVAEEDGVDMGGSGSLESLSALSNDNIALSVNTMPLPKKRQVIPLVVNATSSGLYSLGINQIKNMPSDYQVWLKDNLKKDSLDLRR